MAVTETAANSFFLSIPVLGEFAELTDFDRYLPLPDDWVLGVADVVNSTDAIALGRYKAVNTAGASVITALLNGLGSHDYPFVFGGDGALLAFPGAFAAKAHETLSTLRVWVSDALQLDMRAAIVPMTDVKAAACDVRVARFKASSNAIYTMFAGGGSSWAESQMKAGRYCIDAAVAGSRPDLTGLSCRWDPIPSSNGEIMSLIIMPATDGAGPRFRALLSDVIAIIAEQGRNGHPLPADGPPLTLTTKGIDTEARATATKGRLLVRKLGIFAETMFAIGIDYLGVPVGAFDPKQYKIEVSENSDFRKFDDGLKMTVDIDPDRSARVEKMLSDAAGSGLCRYGIHKQADALMTCFVPSLHARDHIHFIDGAGGGYALAATKMKANFP